MKIVILLNCYNNHHVVKNIYKFFIKIMDENDFDIYLINNNENVKDELIEYKEICKIFKGNNNIYEFTGIQKCLEYLKKFEIINNYDISILITDALFNSPTNYLNFINLEIIRYVFENEICVGNVDSFGKKYNIGKNNFEYWLRSCFLIISNKLFKEIDYKFLSYRYNDIFEKNKIKIKISLELLNKINERLKMDKYKYLDNDIKKNIKKLCIINEYNFSIRLENKISDIFYVYCLCNNKNKYIEKMDDIEEKTIMEQIKLRNEYLL